MHVTRRCPMGNHRVFSLRFHPFIFCLLPLPLVIVLRPWYPSGLLWQLKNLARWLHEALEAILGCDNCHDPALGMGVRTCTVYAYLNAKAHSLFLPPLQNPATQITSTLEYLIKLPPNKYKRQASNSLVFPHMHVWLSCKSSLQCLSGVSDTVFWNRIKKLCC